MHHAIRFALASLVLFALGCLGGCGSTGPLAQPSVEFTKAARSIVDTLGQEYLVYVAADSSLTPAQKLNRQDAVGDFAFAVTQAELANGLATPAMSSSAALEVLPAGRSSPALPPPSHFASASTPGSSVLEKAPPAVRCHLGTATPDSLALELGPVLARVAP